MQPSTVGLIFNCLYTVVVNRTISGFANYPTGVSVLITVNPCNEQVSGFKDAYKFRDQIEPSWNPRIYDIRKRVNINYVPPPQPVQTAAQRNNPAPAVQQP